MNVFIIHTLNTEGMIGEKGGALGDGEGVWYLSSPTYITGEGEGER